MNDEVLTLKEAAEALGVSTLTLKRWGKRGLVKPIRINERGDRRYLKRDIEEYLVKNHE